MASEEPGGSWRWVKRTSRLEAFSDGVFAIAITIIVLNLSVPAGSGDDLVNAFLAQWPTFLAYIVSFATIGAAWLAHSVITEYVDRADVKFARLNLLLLLVVSFLTFPTKLMAAYITDVGAERVATVILGTNLLAISLIISWMWHHALQRSLVRPDASNEEVQMLTHRLTPGVAGYVLFIGVALFLPIVAVFGYLIISLLLIVPLFHIPPRRQT